jgi:hypothetical protein
MKHLKTIAVCFLILAAIFPLSAQQKYTISGHIRDSKNGEGLIGATVFVKSLAVGSSTNPYGFYSLTIPKGSYELEISYLGYVTQKMQIELTSNQTLNFQLEEESIQIGEVVVTAEKPDNNVKSTEMSVQKLEMKTLQRMPALLGEVDVIRSIQLLPGISTVGEGAAGFNVRGGGIDHNLILLDEAPVYNSSHLFGFFSVFNPDAVKDVKLIKGGIPAQYGGRLASLLDVRMKDGNSKRFGGSAGIGTVSSRLAVEAPIVKDKSSFIIAARRSYVDLFLKLSSDKEQRNNGAYFYDLSAKANYEFGEKDKVFVSGYFGRDVFKFGDDFKMDWGNGTGTVRWNHIFNSRLFVNTSAIYSNYDYSLGIPTGAQAFSWKSHIINYSVKSDFSYYINTNNTVTFGVSGIYYRFKPGRAVGTDKSIFNEKNLEHQHAAELGVYVDNEQSFTQKLSVQYGLRWSGFDYLGAHTVYDYVEKEGKEGEGVSKVPVNPRKYGKGESIKFYNNLEPRLSVRYSLDEKSSLKASYNRTAQYIHLISNTTASIPFDVWSPSTTNIKPELADQVALGYFRNFMNDNIETSVEGYYKKMYNQIDYVDGAEIFLNEDLEGELLYGDGRSYGLEFYLKKKTGRLNGWISYTLSKTERKVNMINNNEYYPAKYDKTHNLNVVGIYEITPRWILSGTFSYSTGIATTFPSSKYVFDGLIVPNVSGNKRNNFRVPDYHRLDLSITREGKKVPGRKWESNWVLSLYNAYGRRNTFGIYFRQNEDDNTKTEAVRLAVLGVPLPSITYNIKF